MTVSQSVHSLCDLIYVNAAKVPIGVFLQALIYEHAGSSAGKYSGILLLRVKFAWEEQSIFPDRLNLSSVI
jgi:hypothetical protein